MLVVDDDPLSSSLQAHLAQLLGHTATVEHDAERAVELAFSGDFDLMLLDLGMPKLDGYQVCRHVREQPWGDEVTIIALTGWGQEQDRRRTLEAGFDHHLVKPVDPAFLAKLIEEVDDSGPIAAVG